MGAGILCAGCGGEDHKVQEVPADEKAYGEEITLMHPDADKAEFRQYIEAAEKELDMKIHLLASPSMRITAMPGSPPSSHPGMIQWM